MSQRTSKLLRKIARFAGRTDDYIKKQFKQMTPQLQRAYLSFMRENFRRIVDAKNNPPQPKDTIVTDVRLKGDENGTTAS